MNIGIVGLGLIGGSIGRAAVKRTFHKVFAFDLDKNAMQKGALLTAYHEPLTDENAGCLDLLLICVYPDGVESVLKTYVPLLKDGAVVMDCAGTKRKIVDIMTNYAEKYPKLRFIGGHPMAGREFSGVEHATAGLMDHSTCILVPVSADIESLVLIKGFFVEIGADGVVVTTAEEHDRIIAYTSQLAHIVSSAYVLSPTAEEHYGFSAGSFRDMTRVARLNPDMWTELMTENADYLAEEVFALAERLKQYGNALQNKDREGLKKLLSDGNERKLDIESGRIKKRNDALHK